MCSDTVVSTSFLASLRRCRLKRKSSSHRLLGMGFLVQYWPMGLEETVELALKAFAPDSLDKVIADSGEGQRVYDVPISDDASRGAVRCAAPPKQ